LFEQIFRIGKGDSAGVGRQAEEGAKIAQNSEAIDQISHLAQILHALDSCASDARWQHFKSFSGIATAQ
jgi:hypothetical protein